MLDKQLEQKLTRNLNSFNIFLTAWLKTVTGTLMKGHITQQALLFKSTYGTV